MPRKPRFFVPGCAAHLIQRGNNRGVVFFDESDYQVYLESLGGAATKFGVSIHAYVLMTNHVHLLVTPTDRSGVSRMMQQLGREYVAYVNFTYRRTGTLWEGRFKACPVQTERYLLSCYRYIEMNPVRAGMVARPSEYLWSSFHFNADGKSDLLLTPHAAYLSLGMACEQRMLTYREMFFRSAGEYEIAEVRACTQTGTPYGNQRFRQQIESALGVRVGHEYRGRPPKRDR
ncbi:MAG: transposase [Pseudomonadota bacterium]